MTQLIEREVASHWYLGDGTPYHTVAKQDGTGDRAVTLRDARKVGALPSVTNVLSVVAKPALDAWKLEQAIMASLTLPRMEGEAWDVFARRVVTDMGEQVGKAADLGSAVHAACEAYARGGVLPEDELVAELWGGWREWFDGNVEAVESVERVVVDRQRGYAGRLDIVAKLRGIGWCVVDFKTQKVKRTGRGERRPAFYETWPVQLAAYREAAAVTMGLRLVSVVIDSTEAGPVCVKVWSEEEADYFGLFESAFELWRYVRGYEPGGSARELRAESPEPRAEAAELLLS